MKEYFVTCKVSLCAGTPEFVPHCIARGLSKKLGESVELVDIVAVFNDEYKTINGYVTTFKKVSIGDAFLWNNVLMIKINEYMCTTKYDPTETKENVFMFSGEAVEYYPYF